MIGSAINFSQVNIAWQYDINAPLRFSHRVISDGEKISVFLRIKADSLYKWNYDFFIQDGYETENHEGITPVKIDTLLDIKDQVVVRLDVTREVPDILVIQISRFEEYYYYDIGLKIGKLSFPSIYPIDKEGLPIFENFINRSGFKWANNHSFYVMKYEDLAGPADPPMADMKPLAPKADLDTSFLFRDSIEFEEKHFYTVRKDSLASTGVTILRTPPYYPEYRKLTELVESMLYLTSEAETKSLLNSKDLKKSFDSFWINNFNTKPRARNAIRTYYNNVEKANKLFTDFKDGWKTDRGMILIVFGKPDEVYRTNSLEEWYYDSGELFEFTIISSFFSSRTYTLRRNKAMEENWYRQIASIRKGINE
ncbi:MAG: GWxTD domain-containing protein [Bacteroidota bacterium]